MRGLVFLAAVIGGVFWAATSASDVGGSGTGTSSAAEPTNNAPAASAPGSETPSKSPFAAYGTGPPEAQWDYSVLSADERAYVDHNVDVTGWDGISATYAAAALQTSQQAEAEAAAHQLGLENPNIGVVP